MAETIQIPEDEAPPAPNRTWCLWSTTESIQNEILSVTAILETLVVVPLYWWAALRIGIIYSLLFSVIVAPFVLLRSNESVALGLKWFIGFEKGKPGWPIRVVIIISVVVGASLAWLFLWNTSLGGLFMVGVGAIVFSLPVFYLLIFICSVGVRLAATLVHLRPGIEALPRNFRRLTLCTSPAQIPEIIPGIETTDSRLNFSFFLISLGTTFTSQPDTSKFGELFELFVFWLVKYFILCLLGCILFAPAWFYRLTIKSTAWFWWPLAFLGGDLQKVRNPELLRWDVMDSLWAKASIASACASLLWFAAANVGVIVQHNPLLTPLGYLLLVNWTLRPWQVCALVGAVLSIVLVFWADDVSGRYRIANETQDTALIRTAERNFGWIERIARLRLLFVIAFWCLVGTHAMLYVNSTRCWFSLPPTLHIWAQDIYGDRLPPYNCPSGSGPT